MALAGKTNPLLYTSQKLSHEWSAANFANHLDTAMVHALQGEWQKLDTGVRMRVLLSTLFMDERRLQDVRVALLELIDYALASGEEDDWVKVVAKAVGKLDGQLDFSAVEANTKDVAQTVAQLTQQMQELQPYGYEPLETLYLNSKLVPPSALELAKAREKRAPFRLREGADDTLQAQTAQQHIQQQHAAVQPPQPAAQPALLAHTANPLRQRSLAAAVTVRPTDMFRSSKPEQRKPSLAGVGAPGFSLGTAGAAGKRGKVVPLDPANAPKLTRDKKPSVLPTVDSSPAPSEAKAGATARRSAGGPAGGPARALRLEGVAAEQHCTPFDTSNAQDGHKGTTEGVSAPVEGPEEGPEGAQGPHASDDAEEGEFEEGQMAADADNVQDSGALHAGGSEEQQEGSDEDHVAKRQRQ